MATTDVRVQARGSAVTLAIELIEALQDRGHLVTVVVEGEER